VLLIELFFELLLDDLPVFCLGLWDNLDAAAEPGVRVDFFLEFVEFLTDVVQVRLLALQLVLHFFGKFVVAVLGFLELLPHHICITQRAQLLIIVHLGFGFILISAAVLELLMLDQLL